MLDRMHTWHGKALPVVLVLVACLGPSAPERSDAQAQGVRFERGSLDDAIALARRRGQRVFVEMGAAWCPPCAVLHREVLDRREGAQLLDGMVAIELDFDDPASRTAIERFAIISLPTALVLAPSANGVVEIARVEGYEQKQSWMSAIRAARNADDPLPALERAIRDRPRDARAALAFGKALLARGRADEGESWLERAVWMGGASAQATDHEIAAEALFVLGRFHQRVRRDKRTARHVWRELAGRFPESSAAASAWYWYAEAQSGIGQAAIGTLAMRLRAEARPTDLEAHLQLATQVESHGDVGDRVWVRDRLRALRTTATGESATEAGRILASLETRIAADVRSREPSPAAP